MSHGIPCYLPMSGGHFLANTRTTPYCILNIFLYFSKGGVPNVHEMCPWRIANQASYMGKSTPIMWPILDDYSDNLWLTASRKTFFFKMQKNKVYRSTSLNIIATSILFRKVCTSRPINNLSLRPQVLYISLSKHCVQTTGLLSCISKEMPGIREPVEHQKVTHVQVSIACSMWSCSVDWDSPTTIYLVYAISANTCLADFVHPWKDRQEGISPTWHSQSVVYQK